MVAELRTIFICRRCFDAAGEAGDCPNCGLPRVRYDPGEPGSVRRKPPMDSEGRVLSRAPLWWVAQNAPYLRDRLYR